MSKPILFQAKFFNSIYKRLNKLDNSDLIFKLNKISKSSSHPTQEDIINIILTRRTTKGST